jgi:hypothetical protein
VPTNDFAVFVFVQTRQSLERAYYEGSEGAEGVLDHQVHFSVYQLETGDGIAWKWEPELHELPSKAVQIQLLYQV